jgi:hypothetical protein
MLLESVNYLFYHLIFFVYYYNLLMVPKILLGLEAIFPEADISYIFTFFRHFSTVFSRSKSHRTPTTPFHTLSPHITIQSHPAALPQFTCLLYIYRFIVAPAVSTGH